MMTGVRIELNGSSMAMPPPTATGWPCAAGVGPDDPQISLNALVPAKTLNDTAKALGPIGGSVMLALAQGNAARA